MSYDELSGSPKESLNESSGSTAERKFLVPFDSRLTFAQSFVGTTYPNFPQSRIVAIDIQPWTEDLVPSGTITDPSLTTADYGTQPCLVTVKYGPDFTKKSWPTGFTKPSARGGTELRFQIRGAGQFMTIPSAGLKWSDDPTAIVPADVQSTVLVPTAAFQLQWDFVDDPPISRFETMIGQVNSDTFLGQPPDTILFNSYDISESFRAAPLNPHTNRVVISLVSRKIKDGASTHGWNHYYREEPAGWAKLLKSNGDPMYTSTAMSGMVA